MAGSCEDSWVPTTHTFSQVHGVLSSGGLGLGLGVPVSSRLELGGDPSVSSTSDIRMPRFCKPQVTYFLLRKSKMCAFVPPPCDVALPLRSGESIWIETSMNLDNSRAAKGFPCCPLWHS